MSIRDMIQHIERVLFDRPAPVQMEPCHHVWRTVRHMKPENARRVLVWWSCDCGAKCVTGHAFMEAVRPPEGR